MTNDNTAEQLRARELFEEGVKKWPNYSERTLVRDGRYPGYYGNPVVQGAWEGFKLGLSTRADSGEAVAWRWRDDARPGLPWRTTTDADVITELRAKGGYEIEQLFTHPRASRKVAVPDGYVLVPLEPTEEMKLAGQTAHYEAEEAFRIEIAEADIFANKEKPGTMRRRKNRAAFVYKRMLANAPEVMLASQDEVK